MSLQLYKKQQLQLQKDSSRNQLLMHDNMLREVCKKIDEMATVSSQLATKAGILDSLYFEDMDERHTRIKPAHGKTFSWILDDKETSFKSWLEFESGIFWVRGKAGSGKSTLMKYLGEHPSVPQILGKWAGSRQLVMAKSYFWSPGSPMQKSQEGLLQSLLFQVLEQLPDAIPIAVPDRWEAKDGSYRLRQRWKKEELYGALLKIIEARSSFTKFFFFVDGLDEYWGDYADVAQDMDRMPEVNSSRVPLEDVHPRAKADQNALIELLQRISSSDAVKFCVSSRPWTAFEDAFGQLPERMLILERLTGQDMENYIESELKHDPRFQKLALEDPRATDLIAEIRTRAEGVFLWVHLVILSLLRGLTQRDGIDDLRHRLSHFPSDLRQFFRDTLHTVDEAYRTMTCRLLKLARYDAPLPLMTFWYLKLEHDEPLYAEKAMIKPIGVGGPHLLRDARHHVNKWCHDLLEIHNEHGDSGKSRATVAKIDFLHRTVRAFLLDEDIQSFLDHYAGKDFNESLSMCRVQLAQAKTLPSSEQKDSDAFQYLALDIMRHAKAMEDRTLESPTSILKNLDEVGEQYHGRLAVTHWTDSFPVHTLGYGPGDVQLNTRQGHSNFLAFAVSQDLRLYVQQQLKANSNLKKQGRPLLDYAIHCTFRGLSSIGQETLVDMVDLLLDNGADPNEYAHLWGYVSVWQAFLYSCYHGWTGRETERTAYALLRHGARDNCTVVVEQRPLLGQVRSASVAECLAKSFGAQTSKAMLEEFTSRKTTSWSKWLLGWS